MTREEAIEKAIKALKWFKEYNEEDYCGGDRIQDEYGDWYYRITEQDFEAFDMAIEALKQEPVIDKIRAEIQRLRGCSCSCSDGIIDDVEDILDKYKAESEGKE